MAANPHQHPPFRFGTSVQFGTGEPSIVEFAICAIHAEEKQSIEEGGHEAINEQPDAGASAIEYLFAMLCNLKSLLFANALHSGLSLILATT